LTFDFAFASSRLIDSASDFASGHTSAATTSRLPSGNRRKPLRSTGSFVTASASPPVGEMRHTCDEPPRDDRK
jgi:hypothetical protein